MREYIKRILRHIYHFFRLLWLVNWRATIRLNFRKLPFSTACKLPILVYGKLKIYDLSGRIIIRGPVCRGLVKVGRNVDSHYSTCLPGQWTISHDLIFNGHIMISGGVTIETYKGPLELGRCCVIGSGTMLKSQYGIIIGDFTRIAYGCVIMDTNMHFIKDIETGRIGRVTGPIVIGQRCWLNPGTVASKNAVVPDYTITGRNSLVNKDYSEQYTSHAFIAGAPAKPVSYHVQRIFSNQMEGDLRRYFEENGTRIVFQGVKGEEEDPYEEIVGMFCYNY